MALTVAYNDQQEKGSEGYLRGVHCQRQLAFANQSTVKMLSARGGGNS